MMDVLGHFRQTARQIGAKPSFTALVVLTLGLTIGAAATVFSLFDAVLLRPFPFPEPDRLVRLRTHEPGVTGTLSDASLYDFQDWQRRSRQFAGMAAFVSFNNNLTGQGPARSVRMTFATPELFTLLGAKPVLGRVYTTREDEYGGDVRKVVLGYGVWQEVFGGSPAALGRTLQLRGDTYEVIGVLPPGFRHPDRTEVWVPLMARYSSYKQLWWQRRDLRFHTVLARLAPGSGVAQAQAELDSIAAELRREYPDQNRNVHIRVVPLREAETGEIQPYVVLVGAAVLLLLLIGCMNVANLFVARAASREREFAVRAALGASLGQVWRQLMTESLLYGLLGGALGVLLAWLGVRGLALLLPPELPAWMQLSIDGRVVAFAIVISAATAMLFGLAPLLQQMRPDLVEALKQGGKGSAGAASLASRLRRGLVVAEVALSLVLLVGAGLMLRSFARLMNVDTGIKAEHLVLLSAGRLVPNTTLEQQLTLYCDEFRRVRDRLAAVPGVASVGAGDDLPYLNQPEQRNSHEFYTRRRATREQAYRVPAQGADVMPGYFAALGVPLLEGREFTEADTIGAPPVVVINRHMAETLFPGRSALGEQIRWGNDTGYDPWMTVIGVVGNTRWHPAERSPGFETYWSYRQYPGPSMHFLVRTALEPDTLIPVLRRTVQELNPDLAVERVKTMDTVIAESVWQRRLWGWVLGAFAALALLLAAVGLYGVMSYLVSQRTRELGIRLAIGARPGSVLSLVLGSGMKLVTVGAALGLLGALAAGRLLAGLLFGVNATDPVTYAAVPIVLAAVAALACTVPAVRASRIDPITALREE